MIWTLHYGGPRQKPSQGKYVEIRSTSVREIWDFKSVEITLAEPFDVSSCERGGGAKLFVTARWFELFGEDISL